MDDRSSTKASKKKRKGLTKTDPETTRLIEEFVGRHRTLFIGNRKVENCNLKAKIFSVWPPYGLAIPLDENLFEVGVILFHQSRIIECSKPSNPSGKINIRSNNISKYGIYTTRKRWHKQFQIGNNILARISSPLKDCSIRWKKQCEKDQHSSNPLKLSNLIQYKAVKVWNVSDELSLNRVYENEPSLTGKNVNFDQMNQLYTQMKIDSTFCFEQLLGFKTRQFIDKFVENRNICVDKRQIMVSKTLQLDQIKISDNNHNRALYQCNKFNCKMKSKPCYCNCDNEILREFEPIEDNIYEGKDGILNID